MQIINYFKALADETRLRLLNLLLKHELNVNELVSILDIGQPRVSRHLKILLDSGFLSCRRDGLWIFYSVVSEGEVYSFIDSVKYLLNDEIVFKSDIERCKGIIANRTMETTQFFDSIAGDWKKLKKNIIGDFDIDSSIAGYMNKCKLAVDVGCGTGDLIPVILRKAEKVIGVDRSTKMLEEARRLLAADESRVSLRLGEIEHLPLSDNEADSAILNMVLHHLSSPITAIQEIHRVLKSRSSLIIVDLLKHDDESMRINYGDRWLGFFEDEVIKWLNETNFKIKEKVQFEIKNGLKLILNFSIKQ